MTKKNIIFIIIIVILISVIYEKNIIQKMLHPKVYSKYVEKYSEEYNIDEYLVYSIIKVESKFRKNAISHREAKGLMQISDITRDWAIEELDLGNIDIFDPETNIKIGCWYLNKLYNEFGKLELVIAAYNGGSGNVNKWLKNTEYSKDGKRLHNIPFQETSNYVEKVMTNYGKYKQIYN